MKLLARSRSLLVVSAIAALAACSNNTASKSINTANGSSIIGGSDVAEGAPLQKSIVSIYYEDKEAHTGALCTGSLLPNNVVLTAAHCIGDKTENHLIIFTADLDALFNTQDRNLILQKVRRAVKTVVNPNWGKQRQGAAGQAWGDTALIKFQGTVPAGFAPATILADRSVLTENSTITVAGYGVNKDILTEVNKADIPDFDKQEKEGKVFCEPSADGKSEKCYKEEVSGSGRLRTTELKVAGYYNDSEIAFDQRHGQASCEGDSGGPAYVKQANGEYHLFGVTSRGTRGCDGYVLYSDITSPALQTWLKGALVEVSTAPVTVPVTQVATAAK